MWHLTSENDKRIIFVLSGKNVTIGRSLDGQNCNFAITDDPSISRKHATLLILEGVLYLEDLGSKYGTFVNNSDKIEHNKMIKLSCNDVIKFGKMNCVWKVQKINLITCTSTMKGENLQSLKNILTTVGGIIKNEWDETCEYLTMPAITLTIKVVLALVQNSHIVTIDYWNKCVDAVNNNTALPNPSNFIPQILESTLNKESVSFLPNKDRSSLFASKKVIFFSRRQLELYKMVLTKSSATALLLSESKMTKSALCDEDVIVIQYTFSSSSQETQAQRDQINDIIEYLKNKGKRVVADAEIGLAILYCSISKYCNPSFNFSSEVVKQLPCQNNNKNVLAPESQDSPGDLCKKENLLIDESLTPTNNQSFNNDNSNNTSKRKLSDDDNIVNTRNLPKKFATNTFSKLSLSNSKKRQSEFNDLENPSKKIAVANNKDDDDMFNFVKNDNCKNIGENSFKKKLSLSKPMKRKHSTDNEEEDLFNFVNKENKKTALDMPSNSNSDSVQDTSHSHTNIFKTSKVIDDRFDISALRGSKLKELMLISSNTPCYKYIKKEEVTELDDKFGSIDLGSASLIVRKDLIVKREPIQVPLSLDNGLKNFKKFKKVWPSKMQVTVVSTSA
ncbi:nibrin [Vanessa atalanta]|uniref:nibrin n=1 Tax=Vanessa atalanta TaxID=42275 RepID=UPI001FCDAEEB|nr:nibrin [Vanessa atalanta]